ncbi:MAG: hypothetical protein NT045_06365 [Candidatus Aureabacteria bacterium]|nr:hypothetical protein [Candidatus Auribacterota bacterium]
MKRSHPASLAAVLLCAVIISTLYPSPSVSFPASWPQAYLDSLTATSMDTTQAQISKNLIAVLPGEENLTWNADNSRVLMETFTDARFYPTKNPGDILHMRETWVSSPNELKSWVAAHAFPESDLTLRLKQMLGMPPDADKSYFAEFWVNPADLVRPSPDPEITDHEADLAFPTSPFFAISDTYKTWFNNLRSISYTSDTAHPWTRLGYTYDWENEYDHMGFSEFVIWAGAYVELTQATRTEEYVTITPTVLDLGVGSATVGGHLVCSACVQEFAQPVDIYIAIDSPAHESLSLAPNGSLMKGIHPYMRRVEIQSRTCAELFDITVSPGLSTGLWTVTLAVMSSGAKPSHTGALASYAAGVTIEAPVAIE